MTRVVMAWTIGIFGGLLLLGGLVWGGTQWGWWLQGQNIQHQSKFIRLNYATQEADLQQLEGYIGTVATIRVQEATASGQQLADLKAQALGIGNQACAERAQISISLGPVAGWVRQNCNAGSVSMSSPLRR